MKDSTISVLFYIVSWVYLTVPSPAINRSGLSPSLPNYVNACENNSLNDSQSKKSAAVKKNDQAFGCRQTVISLPAPWRNQDIGSVGLAGNTRFDEKQFTLEGSGTCIDSVNDQCQYAYFQLEGEGEITVRLVPAQGPPPSRMGLMMRETLRPNSPQISLVLNAEKDDKLAEPSWKVIQLARAAAGKPLALKHSGENLTESFATSSQVTGMYWLRLQRKYNSFFAFVSPDGKSWATLGSCFVEMTKKYYAGIAVSSGLKNATTTVRFDHVSIPGWHSEDSE
jgi:hypothetical protein